MNARRPASAHRPSSPCPAPRQPGRGRCSPVHQAGQQFRRQASPQVVRLAEGEKVSSAGVTSRPAGARHQLHVTRLDWPHKRMARAAVVSIGPAIDAGAPGPGVPGGWPPKALGRKPYHSSSQEVTLSQAAKRGGDEREVSFWPSIKAISDVRWLTRANLPVARRTNSKGHQVQQRRTLSTRHRPVFRVLPHFW